MKASQLRRFVTAHFGLSKANLWRGAGHRNFSFLGLALVLLTFHFSPAVVSAQDMTSAKKNCDTATLAKSVRGDREAVEALLAGLDRDCAIRLINEYTTEKDETVVRAVRQSSQTTTIATAST